MILGIWVIVFLFLGFPSTWDKILAILSGFFIIVISYRMTPPPETKKESGQNMPYVESKSEHVKEPNPEQL